MSSWSGPLNMRQLKLQNSFESSLLNVSLYTRNVTENGRFQPNLTLIFCTMYFHILFMSGGGDGQLNASIQYVRKSPSYPILALSSLMVQHSTTLLNLFNSLTQVIQET